MNSSPRLLPQRGSTDRSLRPDLGPLEEAVRKALHAGDSQGLDVLGCGEVTLVVSYQVDGRAYACKRLPPIPDQAAYARYVETLEDYILLLGRTVNVQPTWTWSVTDGQCVTAYCVQDALPSERLLPAMMKSRGEDYIVHAFRRLTDIILETITPTLGLDAQASNWVDLDGELIYLDVTTPMVRDASGAEQGDMGLFCASLPAVLRYPARTALVPRLLRKFYEPRGAVLDLLGNLYKEGLGDHVPTLARLASERLSPRLSVDEVRDYYANDARTWTALQALRQADRAWTRTILRRDYPFLLPADIQR